MKAFIYESAPARVIFGFGTATQLTQELERLCVSRALVLSTPERKNKAEEISACLGAKRAGIFAGAVMHTPVHVTEEAVDVARAFQADVVVAIGGGSTIGLAKAIALRTDLPQVVLPTTYAGSEMTPILGETKDGLKTTQRTLKVLPEVVIYDVELTYSLPANTSITSGINAMAHAVEALYAKDGNPIISLMAEEGIRAFGVSLPRLASDPKDRDARAQALYGAWLCGTCLGAAGMALHHKLCHTLGGSFNLPHAETHTVILPHATAYNASFAPQAMAAVARALRVENAADGLFDFIQRVGAPTSLAQLGFMESDIDRAMEIATRAPYWNPRPVEPEALRTLLTRAWAGKRPHS
ncbi:MULTISPECIES: maleylacetate reductase [Hydrogenophaga]|uniref:Iron-containing alcohol dehydrogenase n=1 Tax=Hydrogenophaga intermedia TaxID=65786 RepID=A0A1L1PL13_HYDIT|nr:MULTISPECIES: maleylacetate reductase [Hydrogenophaga]TMU69934.1 maleylacetate reductase [Hydrogenophaga intermedia]CDN90578.1 Iron-containing alcohol dehydrogenase [Hydrogenophaga intermedia]